MQEERRLRTRRNQHHRPHCSRSQPCRTNGLAKPALWAGNGQHRAHLPSGFLEAVPWRSEGESLWAALPGHWPADLLCSGSVPWTVWPAGGCLLGAALCLLGLLWGLGGQGRTWGWGSVLCSSLCCSASFLLFSSSRFLETKPKKKKSKEPQLLESLQDELKCWEELLHHRMVMGINPSYGGPLL